ISPMQYTLDDATWQREIDYFKEFNTYLGNDPTKVYMGIGWYRESDGVNYFDAAGVVSKINYGRLKGMKGFSIFELGNPDYNDQPLIEALANGPYKNPIASCLASCSLASSGDFNCDGKINESDLNTLLNSWLTGGKDLTGDGKVNESDLNKLLGNWKTI
ncbi:hypothetical protein MUP32_00885, partial [Candidatus Microgenomates bacterium]|nr:hypothetical protein [Candidatus Microgenomates bacterium]